MRIGIDARFWGIEHTGIGRYVMELVRNLEKIDNQNEYIVFLRKKYFKRLKFSNRNFKKVLTDFPSYSFSEQILFRKVLQKEKLDLVHFPHFNLPIFYQGKFVVTIHDLIKHESRGPLTTTRTRFFYWGKYLAYLLTVNIVLRRAQKIIVPSRWWQRRLKKKFGLSSQKIQVTYESVSDSFKKLALERNKKLTASVLKKYEIKKPFIIYTGNLYPHKNIARLVKAVVKINLNRRLYLVIVSAKSIFWQRLKKFVDQQGAKKWVILAGFVPDQELVLLYHEAEAFVSSSLLEGFGLIGLEAMAAGLPVVCSRASCLPEIYQKAACYFNPQNVNDIKTKILKVLGDKRLKKELTKEGYRRIKDFSFLKMAQETLRVYNSLCE